MSLVWERAPYAEGTLLVLLALADWADDGGFSWPSIDGLAHKSRLQRRRVQYIIRKLKSDGFLEIEEGGGRKKRNRYTLNISKLNGALNAPFPKINSALEDKETVHFETETVHSEAHTVHSSAPDPLEEPLDKPSLEPPYSGLGFLTALATFKNHRKQIKRPLSLDGLRLLHKKLSAWPESVATQALEDAVINRWQGVFEPKGFRNGTHEKDGAAGEYQTLAQRGRAAGFDGLLSVVDELRTSGSGGADETIRRKSLAS